MLPVTRMAARSMAGAARATAAPALRAAPVRAVRPVMVPAALRSFGSHAPAAAEMAGAGAQGGKKEGGWLANAPKHPDYEGFEGVVKYYLPHSQHMVVFWVSFYAIVISVALARSKASKRAEEERAPPPEYPNFK